MSSIKKPHDKTEMHKKIQHVDHMTGNKNVPYMVATCPVCQIEAWELQLDHYPENTNIYYCIGKEERYVTYV